MSKVKICAAHNDRGNPSFGNQSDELSQTNWYSHPWTHVIRCKDGGKAAIMAEAMYYFCEETKVVGYSQTNGRETLYREIKKLGRKNYRDLKTKVNTDCCALVDVCLYIAGYDIGQPSTQHILNEINSKFPKDFKIFKSSEYTQSEKNLLVGDILLNTVTHAAMVTNGKKSSSTNTSTSSGDGSGTTQTSSPYLPKNSVSVSDSTFAKKVASSLGDYRYVSDFNKINNLLKNVNSLKDNLSSLKEKVKKGDTYTNKKGDIYKIKNGEGITLMFLIDIYGDYLKILNKYSPTKNDSIKNKTKLVDDLQTKLNILKLKKDSVENSKNIYNTDTWNNMVSALINESNTSDYNTTLINIENEIDTLLNQFSEKIDNQKQDINESQKAIDECNGIIDEEGREYRIIEYELNKYNSRNENITNNLFYNFNNNFSNDYKYWDQNVINKPNCLNFWFDFLETDGTLKEFSIPVVGTRDKAADCGVECIYFKDVPQLIYYDQEKGAVDINKTGHTYIPISNTFLDNFSQSTRGFSAKEKIDELLYDYGYCIEEVSLTTIPIYYLEPNTRIFIYDKETSIEGEYLVDKISIPLAYNGTMNVSATKAPERLY